MAKSVKAVAGPPPVDYSTDANGKTVGTPRIENTVSRLERIAQAALIGLSSGSQVGPQRSAGAAWGAGIGAGASAVRQQGEQQDLLKRQQASQDYEEQQKTTLHKATIAMTNAQTHSYWQKIEDDENAKDTERQKNMGIVNDLNDYVTQNPKSGLTVQTLTAEQAMAMHEADGHTVAKHTFLPIGKTQAKDSQGNDVFEADGVTPKFTKQFAAIGGGSADSKVPMPQGLLDDVKKYSKYDPRLKGAAQLTAGGEVPLTGLLSAYKFVSENKGKEADGWRESKPGDNAVTVNGKTVKRNAFTGETQEYGGVPLAVEKEQAETKLKAAQTAEAWAKAREADAKRLTDDGRHVDAFGNISPLNEKEYNKRYDSFNKSKIYTNLQTLQGSYQQFQQTVSDLDSGKPFTGAASVVGLFNAIGISATPLAGKGFRINENTIREHVDARGLDQAAYQKLLSLQSGNVITPQQIKDYATIAAGVYRDSYINAANEEFRQVGIVDVLPRGNNMPIDPMTARLYLTIAGNNPDLATEAAKKHGWIVPAMKGNQ